MTEDDCLAVWCAGDDWCAITCTAEILGKKWHPVIVHRLLDEPLGFNTLKAEIDGISSNVLSNNLENLETYDIVERAVVSEKPFRVEYSLTERGRELEPVIDAMESWARSNLSPSSETS